MSYCKKFASNISPERIGCLLFLEYNGSLNDRERVKLREDLYRKHADVYVRRMNALRGSCPKNLPPAARAIYGNIKLNSIMVFGPPCSGWWSQMVCTIKDLCLYQKGILFAEGFFAGYIRIPAEDIFTYLDASANCPDPYHSLVNLQHLCYYKVSLPEPVPESSIEEHSSDDLDDILESPPAPVSEHSSDDLDDIPESPTAPSVDPNYVISCSRRLDNIYYPERPLSEYTMLSCLLHPLALIFLSSLRPLVCFGRTRSRVICLQQRCSFM